MYLTSIHFTQFFYFWLSGQLMKLTEKNPVMSIAGGWELCILF